MTFSPYAGPPHNGSATSKLAALSVEETAGPQGERVYAYIAASGGATRDAIAEALSMGIPSVCARVAQLLAAGRLHETDETRPTRSGRQAKVLRARVVEGQVPLFRIGDSL